MLNYSAGLDNKETELINVLTGKRVLKRENELISLSFNNSSPMVISIPHAGVLVPAWVEKNIKISKSLLVDTDIYTDFIYAIENASIIKSLLSPHFVNMNRTKYPIIADGKEKEGAIRTIDITGESIQKMPYTAEEEKEILKFYDAYHNGLSFIIKKARQKHGFALLLDGHALNTYGMKNTPDYGNKRADFTIGTNNFKSVPESIAMAFANALKQQGFTVSIDYPYKGGYITKHYADLMSDKRVYVIQLETRKALYANEKTFEFFEDKAVKTRKAIAKALFSSYKKLLQQ